MTDRAASLLGRIRAPRLLDLAGLGLLTAAATTISTGLGLAVAGVGCLLGSWVTERRDGDT